jgi:protein gp37
MNRSGIPWLINADGTPGYTWSPMSGCGPGLPCYERCWARAYHVRYRGGDFSVKLHPEKLDEPLRLRKPSTIGVCLMGDLFHEDVPDSFVRHVVGTMADERSEPHTFLLLTKRPERARKALAACFTDWPLQNTWLGVSVEDQATADERIPILLDTPAAHRWVSLEPAIGPVDLSPWLRVSWRCSGCGGYFGGKWQKVCPQCGREDYWCGSHKFNGHEGPFPSQSGRALDLVITGCESGPKRRPFDHDWARLTRDQCAAAGVPWYYKQAPDRVSPSVIVEKPHLDGLQHLALPWVTP